MFTIFPRFSVNSSSDISIVSVVDNEFIDYLIIFYKSIVEHNPSFNFKWTIIYDNKYCILSEDNISKLKALYSNFIFLKIDHKMYEKFVDKVPHNLFPSMYKLEIYKMEYEKVIIFDIDAVCLGDISEIFKFNNPISVGRAGKLKHDTRPSFKRRISFNAGFVSYNKYFLNDKFYNSCFNTNNYLQFAEQTLLNKKLRFFPKYIFDSKYNFHATLNASEIENQDVRILHYAGPKPHSSPSLPQMKYWFEAREKYLTK